MFDHILEKHQYKASKLTEKTKSMIKHEIFHLNNENNDDNGDNFCPICYMDFEEGEEIAILFCNHKFNTECLEPWFKDHSTCPICKRDQNKACE